MRPNGLTGAGPGVAEASAEATSHDAEHWTRLRPDEFELARIDEDWTGNAGFRVQQAPPPPYREVRLSDDHEKFFRRWAASVRADFRRAVRQCTFFPFVEVA